MKENPFAFIEEYQLKMEKYPLPEKVREQYKIEKCLKDGTDSWTLLAKNSLTGIFCVIKQAQGTFRPFLEWEYEVLTKLWQEGIREIPNPYCLIKEKESVYFLREYVEGRSLYELKEEGEFSGEEIREAGLALCRLVRQFHELEIPLIHRDIKPENIVRTRENTYILVDFGTARFYTAEKSRDTFVVGSEGTAAPEQYGYGQTDKRTDVYAIGRTLCYLATGDYDSSRLKDSDTGYQLKMIIKKASAFDPEKRYATVEEMEKELRRSFRAFWKTGAVFAFSVMALAGGYFLAGSGKIPDLNKGDVDNGRTVEFHEPLIEEAVRKALGLEEKTPVSEEMLEEITELRIVGNTVLEAEDDLQVRQFEYINGIAVEEQDNGGISDLTDLSYMKNLSRLVLCSQEIEDLSALEKLPLESLWLTNNEIIDFSSLVELPRLEEAYLGDNPCVDMEPLKECIRMKKLNIDTMEVRNLDFLETLELERLSLLDTRIASGGLTKLLTQEELQILYCNDLGIEEAEVVSQLDSLLQLFCYYGYELGDITRLEGMDSLNMAVIGEGLVSLEGIDKLPSLQYLHIQGSGVTDVSAIQQVPELVHLGIRRLSIQDYTPILSHPSLEEVFCDEKQKQGMIQADPDSKIIFTVEE